MSTDRFTIVLLAVSTLTSSAEAQARAPNSTGCLHYEPHVVRIIGRLVTEPHFGPPNFGETPDQDRRLDVPVLQLAQAIDVCGDPTSATDQDTIRNVARVQVVAVRIKLKAFVGQDVTVIGHLYEAFTGNHFTKVLIFADSVRLNDRGTREL